MNWRELGIGIAIYSAWLVLVIIMSAAIYIGFELGKWVLS